MKNTVTTKFAPKVARARQEILSIDTQTKVTRIFAKIPLLRNAHDRLLEKRAALLASSNGRRAWESLRKEGYTN